MLQLLQMFHVSSTILVAFTSDPNILLSSADESEVIRRSYCVIIDRYVTSFCPDYVLLLSSAWDISIMAGGEIGPSSMLSFPARPLGLWNELLEKLGFMLAATCTRTLITPMTSC